MIEQQFPTDGVDLDATLRVLAMLPGELYVDDDGPGVLEPEIDTTFDARTRGQAAGSTAGTGVGLFLVRRFAEFHGAAVRYERSHGGRRFVAGFPR